MQVFIFLTPINFTLHLHCKRNFDNTASHKTSAKLISINIKLKFYKSCYQDTFTDQLKTHSALSLDKKNMLSSLGSICCFAHIFFLSICMILSSWLSGSPVQSLHKPWIAIFTCVYIVDSFEDGVMLVLLTTVVTTGECSDPQFESEWNWATRSATHCAVSLASASWSQHSSIVWTKPAIPCVLNTEW